MADIGFEANRARQLSAHIDRLLDDLNMAVRAAEVIVGDSVSPRASLPDIADWRRFSRQLRDAAEQERRIDIPGYARLVETPVEERREVGGPPDVAVIHLETDSIHVSLEVVEAWKRLARACGVQLAYGGQPKFGSFLQRFKLRVRGDAPMDEVDRRLQKLEYATEVALLGKPMADADKASAEAILALANAAAGVDNLVAMSRATVFVKVTDVDGVVSGVAKSLTVAEVKEFERNPELLRNAGNAIEYLTSPERAMNPGPGDQMLEATRKQQLDAPHVPLEIEGPDSSGEV